MKPVRSLLWQSGKCINFMSSKAIKHKRHWWFRRENTASLGTFYFWNSNLYIYNLCIDKNTFPKVFKEAKVIPLFKSGDKLDPSNFRPISILPILSKRLEKHINEHVMKHLHSCEWLVLSKAIRIQTKTLLPHSLNRTDRHLAIRNKHKQIVWGLVHWLC